MWWLVVNSGYSGDWLYRTISWWSLLQHFYCWDECSWCLRMPKPAKSKTEYARFSGRGCQHGWTIAVLTQFQQCYRCHDQQPSIFLIIERAHTFGIQISICEILLNGNQLRQPNLAASDWNAAGNGGQSHLLPKSATARCSSIILLGIVIHWSETMHKTKDDEPGYRPPLSYNLSRRHELWRRCGREAFPAHHLHVFCQTDVAETDGMEVLRQEIRRSLP